MKTCAVVQRAPMHSELFGGIEAVCRAVGLDTLHIYADPQDPFLCSSDAIRDIRTFPLGEHPVYDVVILVTVDEWRLDTQETMPKARVRVIGIFHDFLRDSKSFPEMPYLSLTPFAGPDRWLFPLILSRDEESVPPVSHEENVVDIAIVGCIQNHTKDCEDILRFVSRENKKLTVYARHPGHTPDHPNILRKIGLSTASMLDDLRRTKTHVWFPILQESAYARSVFTGALEVAVKLENLVMIMPRFLAEAYFPEADCVLTYDTSIAELEAKDFTDRRDTLLQNLRAWKQRRMLANVHNFRAILDESKKVHLVIARYKESLEWLDALLQKHSWIHATVYNDGPPLVYNTDSRVTVVPGDGLPQEATKYLRHILGLFDTQPTEDQTLVFLQGDPLYHNPYLVNLFDYMNAWDPQYQNLSLWAHPPPWGCAEQILHNTGLEGVTRFGPDAMVFEDRLKDNFQGVLFEDPWIAENFCSQKNLTVSGMCETFGLPKKKQKNVKKAYAAMFATSWKAVRAVGKDTWTKMLDYCVQGQDVKFRACVLEYMWAVVLAS